MGLLSLRETLYYSLGSAEQSELFDFSPPVVTEIAPISYFYLGTNSEKTSKERLEYFVETWKCEHLIRQWELFCSVSWRAAQPT